MTVRQLKIGDEKALNSFLLDNIDTSLFLLNNVKLAGLSYAGNYYEAEYWAYFDESENMQGVLAHCWNGNIIVQMPKADILHKIVSSFKTELNRPVVGTLGTIIQVDTVLEKLGLLNADFSMSEEEDLFKMKLSNLIMPAFDSNLFSLKHISEIDRNILIRWQVDYEAEALMREKDETLENDVKESLERVVKGNNRWYLEYNGTPVAMCGFNARLSKLVQIGPVWTPPEYRGEGYARLVLALALRQAVEVDGITESVLFTKNPAAEKAYKAIGYERIGDYKISILKEPLKI